MQAQVNIVGWSSSGLRCPDYEIRLSEGGSEPPHVSLIQMPNGTGKTTTLRLLRAALSGEATRWSPEDINDLAGPGADSGIFLLDLQVDGAQLTFEIRFNFIDGTARYRTTFGRGIEPGHNPPLALQRYLRPEFVNLFVFDGELAVSLMDSQDTKAREAMDTVFQVSLLELLATRFESEWERAASSSGVREQKGLNRRRNKYERLHRRHSEVKKRLTALKKARTELAPKKAAAEQAYNEALKAGADAGAALSSVQKKLEIAEMRVATTVRNALNAIRDPHTLAAKFAVALRALKANLDVLKLPRSTSRDFFLELSQLEYCICDRPHDAETRLAVVRNADRFLDDDQVGFLNMVKGDIGDYVRDEPLVYESHTDQAIHALADAVRERDQRLTEFEALEQQRLQEGGQELQERKEDLERLTLELEKVEEGIRAITRDPDPSDDEDTDCLKALERMVEEAKADFASASETLELKEKTEIITKILRRSAERARTTIRAAMVAETNTKLLSLLPLTPVTVSDVEDSLRLDRQRAASVGQTLAVGYAFLTTLFERGAQRLPFVVDSPAGALDNTVRTEVAKLLPELGWQFVAFMISSERGSFVEPLHAAAKGNVRYITVYRNRSANPAINRARALSLGTTFTDNGDSVVAVGRDFFERFDLSEEA